ncbi:MAG: ATP-binding protein [Candidatus Competibacteraceae bacterium]
MHDSQLFNLTILNSLSAHIAVLNRQGVIIAVNDAWCHFARENEAPPAVIDGVGLNYLDACRIASGPDTENAQECLAGLLALLAGTMAEFEWEYPCHSPEEERWFSLRAVPLQGPEGGLVVSHINITRLKRAEAALSKEKELAQTLARQLAEDLSARKQAEQCLRNNQRLLKGILNAAPTVYYLYDIVQQRTIHTTTQSAAMLGYSVANLHDFGGTLLPTLMHPDDRERSRAHCRRLLSSRDGEILEFDYRMRHKNGTWRWFLSRDTVFSRTAAGEPQLILGIALDITAHKQAEQALQEADRRKDEFLAMLAHELRNPLAPIRNAVEVLKRLDFPNPKLQWVRDVIDRQVSHVVRLVDDLLDISRIIRGKIMLQKAPVELAIIVNQAVESVHSLIESQQHRLEVSLPTLPVRLEGDSVRLTQILSNLLNNAAKYTPQGGHIQLEAEVEGNTLVLRVRDNGAGIPDTLLPYVFDLFTQAERTLDRSQGGLGIGLTLVRHLVELHGGRIEAKSAGSGQGAEFTVYLPGVLESASDATAETDAETALKAETGARILVVDDNVDVAESMAVLLELEGHQVRTVYTAHAALEAARTFRPDVVLLDIGLPGMDGYEVARRLRASPATRHVLLIALTGYGREEDRARSKAAGFDRHLVKPVEPEALNALIAALDHA